MHGCLFMHLHNPAKHSTARPSRACQCTYTISNSQTCAAASLMPSGDNNKNTRVHKPLRVFPWRLDEPTWKAARTSSSSASHCTACWISWMSWWGWQAAVPSGHQRLCPVRSSWTWPPITANLSLCHPRVKGTCVKKSGLQPNVLSISKKINK